MFHLGWFLGSGFSVQTWAMDPWAGSTGHDWMKGDLFVDLAASLERARFDYLLVEDCLLYTSPSPRDQRGSRMPSSA